VEAYFPGFLSFTDSTEHQQISRPKSKRRHKVCTICARKKDIPLKINSWSTNIVISFIKQAIRKEEEGIMIIIYKNIKRIILSLQTSC
jgi:hypothetical protein